MKKLCTILLLLPAIFLRAQPTVSLIPQPVRLQVKEGSFVIDKNTAISFAASNRNLQAVAQYFAAQVKHLSGFDLALNKKEAKQIILKMVDIDALGKEGYHLRVSPASITIEACEKAGVFYGLQSLLQLLPPIRTNAALEIAQMEITDYPRFPWRGMHLDVSRHFFSPQLVKEYISLMAQFKLNTFHWHLTDDQGWRIEIKSYPKLTSVGAWRVDETDKIWSERTQAVPGQKPTYGGYYTQEQIKDIVRYAAERNITIVPELDVPGHSAAAIAAYPFLSCTQQPQLPMTGGNYTGVSSNLCPGNDSVFQFLENVYTEVLSLFPSAYIHIGGDEVDKTFWKNCAKCQRRMREEGIKDVEGLQSYFVHRMEKFLISKNRKLIGWDEILEGGLAPQAAVMSWRGEAGGIEAAKMHHYVVMTPGSPLYFDHYQADPATEPVAIGGFNSLKKVYQFEPIPAVLTAAEANYIMGAQANLWTEYITKPAQVTYMVLPRMLALAEVVWSPKAARSWDDFNVRLQPYLNAFDQRGLAHSKGNFKVDIKPVSNNGQLLVLMTTEAYNGSIYFTTNGKQPAISDKKYTAPVPIDSSVTIKAITVVNDVNRSGSAAEQQFVMHKAIGRNVKYASPNSRYYPAEGPNILTDGVRGSENIGQYWHGFAGKNLIATIDLGSIKSVHSIGLGCLQKYADWIFLPAWVQFEISTDGENFTKVGTVQNPVAVHEKLPVLKTFTTEFGKTEARYIRVTAQNTVCPPGHPGEGKPAWIFADEIIVE